MALEKFVAQLKAKSKTLGVTNLSNKRIDALAATLEKQNPNLSTDDDHGEKVDALLELIDIKEIAAFDDYQRTKAQKTDGKKDDKRDADKKEDQTDVTTSTSTDSNLSPDVKALMDTVKNLAETVGKLQAEKNQQTVQAKLKETLKDVPASFYDEWALPEKEEDFEAFTEKVKTKWEAFTKENPVQQQQQRGHQPQRSTSSTDKGRSKEELDELIGQI